MVLFPPIMPTLKTLKTFKALQAQHEQELKEQLPNATALTALPNEITAEEIIVRDQHNVNRYPALFKVNANANGDEISPGHTFSLQLVEDRCYYYRRDQPSLYPLESLEMLPQVQSQKSCKKS